MSDENSDVPADESDGGSPEQPDGGSPEQPDNAETETALKRPQWREDLLLLGKLVAVTYAGFLIVGLLAGLSLNAIAGALQAITFYTAVFGLVVLALNLHWGYTGLFNIGVAGFMAIGAYGMSIAAASPEGTPAGLGLPLPIAVVIGVVAAGAVGFVAALPALRVRADYFAIVTLGVSEIIRLTLLSGALRRIEIGDRVYGTGGGSGISAPPTDGVVDWLIGAEIPIIGLRPFGILAELAYAVAGLFFIQPSVVNSAFYTAILLVFVVAFYLLLTRIAYSPAGRVLKAIRDDELAARSLGKDTSTAKIKVFVLGCALMGLAGILWQGSRTNVSPEEFMPLMTFYIFVALIIGGAGSNTGGIVGAFAFAAFLWQGPRFVRTVFRENLTVRGANNPYEALAELVAADPMPLIGYLLSGLDEIRWILVGVVLIVMMIKRPDGLLGHRKELSAATDITRPPALRADGGEEPTPPDWATDRSESDEGGDDDE